jgi:hypothetical protein
MKLTGENRTTRRKTCPSATLSTTNPTRTDPGSNSDLRGERPTTNRLSHGTANFASYCMSTRVWSCPTKISALVHQTDTSFGSHLGHEWTCMSWSIASMVLIPLRYVVHETGFGSAVFVTGQELRVGQPSSIVGTSFTFRSLFT